MKDKVRDIYYNTDELKLFKLISEREQNVLVVYLLFVCIVVIIAFGVDHTNLTEIVGFYFFGQATATSILLNRSLRYVKTKRRK